ncbi:Delta-1-pyrroline-5-carboxylate synthase 1 [Camellia lanceoleosa]|uniref:Delta-1-pyrroline-5-carboxylate synthase 1 n=1 Tax=Camellia lanceoleosa TaxID=1840588 RepID=A0ACC0GQ97_9ERIC|nr:Delta-1-pyrroline-5-carboxylate synthase 1 [Camellia lanceoleosa]
MENEADVAAARLVGYEQSLIAQLTLKPGKISSLANLIHVLANMEEPIGDVLKKTKIADRGGRRIGGPKARDQTELLLIRLLEGSSSEKNPTGGFGGSRLDTRPTRTRLQPLRPTSPSSSSSSQSFTSSAYAKKDYNQQRWKFRREEQRSERAWAWQ